LKGGLFLRKKPLGAQISVKSRIENAVIGTGQNWTGKEDSDAGIQGGDGGFTG
jgi:hypothetical protein